MFCHNCGASWDEGIAFCGKCGTDLRKAAAPIAKPIPEPVPAPAPEPVPAPAPEPVPAPAPIQPAIFEPAPVPAAEPAPQKPAPKDRSRFVKPLRLSILITMLVSLLLVLISGVTMLSTNVSQMGIVTWGLDTFQDFDLEDELESIDKIRREMSSDLRKNEELKSEEQIEDQEDAIKQFEDIQEDHSVLKLFRFADYLAKEHSAFDVDAEELEVLQSSKTAIYITLAVLYFLPLLFALLGGLLKNTGLTVTAAVFTLLVQVLFSAGIGLILGSLLVYILQIVLCQLLKACRTNAASQAA